MLLKVSFRLSARQTLSKGWHCSKACPIEATAKRSSGLMSRKTSLNNWVMSKCSKVVAEAEQMCMKISFDVAGQHGSAKHFMKCNTFERVKLVVDQTQKTLNLKPKYILFFISYL